jgi:drug/metabolite transporter (DMT)-like permease
MSLRAWALFAAVSVIWGMPYLFIKIAVDDGLTPGFVAWSRITLAALVLMPLAWRAGALRGLPLRWLALFALVEVAIPFPLIGFGEQRISSSLTAIVVATLPLVVAFLALRLDEAERATPTRLVGMLIGLGGVVALVGIDVGGRGEELLGVAAVLVATTGYACGALLIKRKLSEVDPLGPVTAAMAIASLMLLPFGVADFPAAVPTGEALTALIVLGLICSALAFLLIFRLIAEVGPGRATVITYVNPIVALALGVAVLGEDVTSGAIAGLLLILAGSWLSTDGRLPPGLAAIAGRVSLRRYSGADPPRPRARELRAPASSRAPSRNYVRRRSPVSAAAAPRAR